ncbi:MAG: hypothetical protein RLZZ365_935 [Pseudomonadota bacterium]|jgi:hypothetical protein
MKTILQLLSVSIFALSSNVAFAAWDELGSNEFITILIDKSSIKKSGDKVQVLSMLDLKKPGVEPKTKLPVNSIIGLNEYYCGQVQYRPLEVKFMSGKRGEGKVVDEIKTPDSSFEAIVSGDWPAGVYNLACRAN